METIEDNPLEERGGMVDRSWRSAGQNAAECQLYRTHRKAQKSTEKQDSALNHDTTRGRVVDRGR